MKINLFFILFFIFENIYDGLFLGDFVMVSIFEDSVTVAR